MFAQFEDDKKKTQRQKAVSRKKRKSFEDE
jgi:hypothetical protein